MTDVKRFMTLGPGPRLISSGRIFFPNLSTFAEDQLRKVEGEGAHHVLRRRHLVRGRARRQWLFKTLRKNCKFKSVHSS